MLDLSEIGTRPGVHHQFVIKRFGDEEQKILRKLLREWYLSNSGSHLEIGAAEYDYFLMKPTSVFTEMFNLEREIIAVFSPYRRFEPRTLDAFDVAQKRLSDFRVEAVCKVLISKDPEIESKIQSIIKTEPEQPIIIPFTYAELIASYNEFFLRNRFRKHFYARDLFAFLAPLKKDLYFFGRGDLVQEVVNRHRSGEHTGLFGLRRSGKTSIIYAVERHLSAYGEQFLSIDCETPAVHMLRWNELLHTLVLEYRKLKDSKYTIPAGSRYDEKYAADSFSKDILGIYKSKKRASTLLIFDEIERISPRTGSSLHWREGEDFIYFWQTLRSFFQRNPSVFTFMLVGTNPSCVEFPVIAGQDNPLFGCVPAQYVSPFDVEQVREMVRKLGRFIGLQFDELIYGKLTEDLGGHSFLIRQMCSEIHRACVGDRPARVDKALYDKIKKQFTQVAVVHYELILKVLRDWYPEEYDMLCFLAQGDIDTFTRFAQDNERYTKHLIGYGLMQQSANGYSFSTEAMRDFLTRRHKYERLNLSDDDKLAEISARRNRIEKRLRSLVRNALRIAYGRKKAREAVISALPEARREKLSSADLDTLLDKDSSEMFFFELGQVVLREWAVFQNIFEMEKERFSLVLQDINKYRSDAHAKHIGNEEFTQLRIHFKKIESVFDDWEASGSA